MSGSGYSIERISETPLSHFNGKVTVVPLRVTSLSESTPSLVNRVLDLIFPPRCASCHQTGEVLCRNCVESFPQLPDPHCEVCATPLQGEDIRCYRCRQNPPAFSKVSASFLFQGSLKQAIHAFKFKGKRSLAPVFVDAMLDASSPLLVETLSPNVMLCPVPLHPDRLAERGYNQSALLAEALSLRAGCGYASGIALRRIRSTVSQTTLGINDRAANLKRAFSADKFHVEGHTIVLIDDVCTSGATLHHSALALKEAGAREVMAIVLARAGANPQFSTG